MSILSMPSPAYPSPPPRASSSPDRFYHQHPISVSSPTMGGNNPNNQAGVDGVGQLTYQRAIDIARNTEGDLDPNVATFLEEAVSTISNKLTSHPDSYILSKDEFAVFNYYRQRFSGDAAEHAVDRYWRSTHAGDELQQQSGRS